MATACTHIIDGVPVTEVVEDGKARPYRPEDIPVRVIGSGTREAALAMGANEEK